MIVSMLRGKLLGIFNGTTRIDAQGDTIDGIPLLSHFGFISRPKKGAEVVVMRSGQRRVIIADGDSRYTVELKDGETAIFDDSGNTVHLMGTDGMKLTSRKKVIIDAPDIEIGAGENLVGLCKKAVLTDLATHTHTVTTSGGPTTQAGTTLPSATLLSLAANPNNFTTMLKAG
jgi:phage gp45-like